MRIDSSGNLLVNTTDTSLYNNTGASDGGFAVSNSRGSWVQIARDDGAQLFLNLLGTNDGGMAAFFRNGSQVGSIGTAGGSIYIGNSSAKGVFFTNGATVPGTSGSGTDNTFDLGTSGSRWKDLYLGGGLYVGGTGSANKLDDYEEGTFTPEITDGIGSRTHSVQQGYYTKIGRVCRFKLRVRLSAGTANSNRVAIGGLPFTSLSNEPGDGAYWSYVDSTVINSTTTNVPVLWQTQNESDIKFYKTNGTDFTGNDLNSATPDFYIVGTYQTN